VYMDGHERPDVVEYRNAVFLPLIASLKKQMVQWAPKGSELEHIDPDLEPGERRVSPTGHGIVDSFGFFGLLGYLGE
jgi:hypothetical protein